MRFLKKAFAPFLLIKRENFYIGWIIYAIFFGMINLLADLLMGDFEDLSNYVGSGQFYTFSIALCAPFIIDLSLSLIVGHCSKKKIRFLKHKIACVLITIVLLFSLCFLWVGTFKNSLKVQLLVTMISLVLSYYMFLVCHMEEHIEITSKYDDEAYHDEENNRLIQTQKKTEHVSEINMYGEKVDV